MGWTPVIAYTQPASRRDQGRGGGIDLQLGVLPEGYIYPKATQAVRDLLRKRAHLVRQHTANVLSVQNILVRHTGARLSLKRIRELTKAELEGVLSEADPVLAVTSSLAVLDCLSQQIKTLEQSVHQRLQQTSAYEQPLTVKGSRASARRSYWIPRSYVTSNSPMMH
jgi:hypothetical protein